jgi:hypothetical protein
MLSPAKPIDDAANENGAPSLPVVADAKLTDAELAVQYPRPTTRSECLPGGSNAARPCPYVSCRYHLYLNVQRRTGRVTLTFPRREVGDIPETCAIDVAERGPQTLQQVGEMLNVSRERVRQIEKAAVRRMAPRAQRLLEEV